MGGSQSVEIPGGGSEGYHVLRVSVVCRCVSLKRRVARECLAVQRLNRGRGC